jgi:hypothetical protein
MRFSVAVLSLSLTIACAPSAFGQQGDAATRAAARTLAEEGVRLYDKGDYTGALEKLSRANDLVHAPTMAYLMGQCLEKLGRLVEASEKYVEATRDPLDASVSQAQRTAQANAEKARQALLLRIPTVELALEAPVPDAVVVLDGKPLPPAMLGLKRPIDPGAHTLVVTRWGQSTSQAFTIKETEAQRIILRLPGGGYAPPGYAPGYAPSYPPGYGPAYPPPKYVRPEALRANNGMFVGGVVMIPIGATLALAGGVVLGLKSATGGVASPAGGATLLVLGIGLGAGGIAMVVIGGRRVAVEAPKPAAPAARVTVEPLVGLGSGGVRVRF